MRVNIETMSYRRIYMFIVNLAKQMVSYMFMTWVAYFICLCIYGVFSPSRAELIREMQKKQNLSQYDAYFNPHR